MANNILSWIKGNYEKVILGFLILLLIIMSLRLFIGEDFEKELADFKKGIQPPARPIELPPVYNLSLENYLVERTLSQYQPLTERDMFFPVEIKKPTGPSIPDMNLECIGVVSEGGIFLATFKDSQTGKIYKAKEGARIENWTVIAIDRNMVILSGNDKQYRLKPPPIIMPFKLTGIMPVESYFEAMLQNTQTGQSRILAEGAEWNEWKVLSIDANKVIIFRPDSGKYELKRGAEPQRIEE